MQNDPRHLREDYSASGLDFSNANPDPLLQFDLWFKEAIKAQLPEPNALTLATVTPELRPAARVVLLKGYDASGFVFFTNYHSRKGLELDHMPHVSMAFLWLGLQRQVRIDGIASKISEADSTAYFHERPRGNQLGAWASPQSQVIPSREYLEEKLAALEEQYKGQDLIPKPPHWGGYIVKPSLIEFWQGRGSRLHDRLQYSLLPDQTWKIERLAP
jgi:pyridoxamine 5'-phosphate oxidase